VFKIELGLYFIAIKIFKRELMGISEVSDGLTFLSGHDDAVTSSSSSSNISNDWVRNKIVLGVFQAASYLTDPICKTHEFYRRIHIVDALNPTANPISNLVKKIALSVSIFGLFSLAIFTTLPGIALRVLGSHLQKNPFIYMQGESEEKVLPSNGSFSLLSWNICAPAGGYAISDGGVLPWAFRIDDIIDKIVEKNADVNCLYEVFDVNTAVYIFEKLKKSGYNHFYFNIGPKAIGVTSGILVASKYSINNSEFTPFPQDTLIGRTKAATKGVFAFDLESQGRNFARIYSTHLQHSAEPQFPKAEEIEARRKQMQIIIDKLNTIRDRCIVVTGDLNLDDEEYRASFWHNRFQKGDLFYGNNKTWGGDGFCAKMVGQQFSCPLNLDHTMILNGTAHSISTSLVETGFDPDVFREKALSDHAGLLSRIYV
jgi:endonuclease/exonuclease/phosphatase family metal-dependent hydrolase